MKTEELVKIRDHINSILALEESLKNPESELGSEVRRGLSEIYSIVWGEAFYDAYNEKSYEIANRLWPHIKRLKELLKF